LAAHRADGSAWTHRQREKSKHVRQLSVAFGATQRTDVAAWLEARSHGGMRVYRSMIIDAPVERVWAVVRRFDAVAVWNPGVAGCCMENGSATEIGGIRVLDLPDGNVIRETLLGHSDRDRFYSYDILTSPLPVWNYIAKHSFIAVTEGNKTLGIWEVEFDCAAKDSAGLEKIIGDGIFVAGMRGLNEHLKASAEGQHPKGRS
jgi:ligand-binding SRPBCC domain-containing protein